MFLAFVFIYAINVLMSLMALFYFHNVKREFRRIKYMNTIKYKTKRIYG